jgi:hypothetical protein
MVQTRPCRGQHNNACQTHSQAAFYQQTQERRKEQIEITHAGYLNISKFAGKPAPGG